MLAATPDSPEMARLVEEWARLRLEYGRLTDLAAQHNRPAPDPWPVIDTRGEVKRELADRSDELLTELAHLTETEELKRREPISTGPYHELSDEVSASVDRVSALGEESERLGDEAATGTVSIEDLDRAEQRDLVTSRDGEAG